jgi:ribose transport system permease protein
MESSPHTQAAESPEEAPPQGPAEPEPERRRLRFDAGAWAPVLFFVLLVVIFGLAEPEDFLSTGNVTSILNNNAILAIIALGLTVVLLTGEFDLSVASAASLGGALGAVMVANEGISTGLAFAAVIGAGILIGLANGILVTYFQIPALIVTLAVASILDGFTQLLTNNEIIFAGFSESFLDIGGWTLGNVQAGVFYLAIIALVLGLALRYTATGRHLHAVGGNREASRMAGIRVNRHIILAFVVSGLLAALAGLIYTSRQGSLTPLFGTAFLLPAFAAAFLGSVTLRRGEFHVLGTVIAVYLIGTGITGLLIVGGPTYTQQLFAGAVLILATAGSRVLGGRISLRQQLGFRRRRAALAGSDGDQPADASLSGEDEKPPARGS